MTDAAVVTGLAGVAVTQPVLDLFGSNPTFFVAGGYGRRQIVAFALAVAFVPALVVSIVSAVPGLVSRHAGAWLHGLAVAGLAGVFGLVLGQTSGLRSSLPALGLALVIGVGVAVLEWRLRPVRLFLTYLAAGNVAFVALFLLTSPTAALLGGVSYADAGGVTVPPLPGPVAVVVLDEFPLTSLLRADGTINDARYPNLAALAEETTWFRNAASESPTTFVSVPSILTGLAAEKGQLPFLSDHPRNYFTLFGSGYPVTRYEVVTDLCPPDVCERPPAQPLRRALDDAWVVYQHRVLPERLRAGLPDIDHSWGDFGHGISGGAPAASTTVPTSTGRRDPMARVDDLPDADRGRDGQAAALLRQIELIEAVPSIHFIHVVLPHHPYHLTPRGGVLADSWNPDDMPEDPTVPGYEFMYRELTALQALQVGAVDQMVGHLVDHLKSTGAWEDATLVLTSDHGVDISPPGFTRKVTPDNVDELFRIPLFIKAPGQTEGEVRDDPASTIDILPSLVDILDVDTGWAFDGHSLFDGSRPTRAPKVDDDLAPALDVAAGHARDVPGEGWEGLVSTGASGDLVGTPLGDLALGPPSDLSWTADDRPLFASLPTDDGRVPYLLTGSVASGDDEPPEVLVAVNGTVAGSMGAFSASDGGGRTFFALLGPFFVDGANTVEAYEV
ncbi:MAG TPA: sulfatase-like hydrolase/transferase, partial [Acidimicrobiales bacterium]|nr:sulfatase-like hydrolase/transferase [Acidimicrobiales bacterium]